MEHFSLHLAFVAGLALFISAVLGWGFFTLPKEGWQMVAALPVKKDQCGQWKGMNLTWYGVLSANAYTFGVVMAIVLAASAGISTGALVLITSLVLAVTIPASKIIARIVEKKRGTFTVGGAVFAGALAAPWIIVLVNRTLGTAYGVHIPMTTMMACVSIGYTFGEALGRLACLSFGCCYGKPLDQCSPLVRKLFSRFYVVFTGTTKKIAYASGMDGERMVPVQMVTAVIYGVAGLAGTWLFLEEKAYAALVETLVVTQVWRVASEFFRADYRGDGKFSMYQIMALAAMVYIGGILVFFPETQAAGIHLAGGLTGLWHPGMILFIQSVWVISFFHCGRSSVTDSRIVFQVVRDNI